jgi:ABC-type transport system involved in multi-copper enzyme maturation permease subunit
VSDRLVRAVAGFELKYQLRNPLFWAAAVMLFALAFLATASPTLKIGAPASVHVNAPRAIAQTHLVFAVLYMLSAVAFVAGAAVRDKEIGFAPVLLATPLGAADHVLGRLLGALVASAGAFLVVPLAMLLATWLAPIDPGTLGPNRPRAYFAAFALLALPSIASAAALLFAMASLGRSMMAAYLGVLALLMIHVAAGGLAEARPELRSFASLLDPFGLAALRETIRYWTVAESNALLPPLAGPLFWGRLLWLAVACAAVAAASRGFRRAEKSRSARGARAPAAPAVAPAPVRQPSPCFRRGTAGAQFRARAALELKLVFSSPAFLALLVLGLLNAAASLLLGGDQFGVPTLPVTREVIPILVANFSIVPTIVAIYYAGETVWRERDRGLHEIVDATPLPAWALVAPKMLAVALVLLAMVALSAVVAAAAQLYDGGAPVEPGKYLLWYILPVGADAVLIAVLAVFVQTVAPHKYAGWGLMVLYMLLRLSGDPFGFEHHLAVFGAVPDVPLSDMNGAGSFWQGAWWFRLHWASWGAAFLLASHLLWRHGTETRLRARLAGARIRLRGRATAAALALGALIAATGGWIVYNTTVLNEHRTGADNEAFAAEYERRYARFAALPQPTVAGFALDIALYPEERRAEVRGRYRLQNRSQRDISDIHVRLADRDVELLALGLEGSRLTHRDDRFGYRIYRLDRPLAPRETRTLAFATRRNPRGFRDGEEDIYLVGNGTFLTGLQLAPVIGMDRDGLLQEPSLRRRHGLGPVPRPPRLEDRSAADRPQFGGGWARGEITISTAADQIPIGPGEHLAEWTHGGRRFARFGAPVPMLSYFPVHSARYAVRRRSHQGVELAVYHHPGHGWNVEPMLDALAVGLDYHRESFGPYPLRQLRIVEYPAFAGFAQSFSGTLRLPELIAFVADLRDPRSRDHLAVVAAHELSHQWWVHQLMPADAQGSAMLSEMLAQYSAMMVMRRLVGEEGIRRFLRRELDEYLGARGFDPDGELPLARAENQQYIHYHKGALAMYLLQERLGERAVNRALARLLRAYRFAGPPFPRSSDLIALLRGEARTPAQQALITDLFERITLYDLAVVDAASSPRADGRWDVLVTVDARKLHADGRGVEREAPLAEPIEIGLFAAEPGDSGFDGSDVISIGQRTIRAGRQRLRFVAGRRPTHAGIDPYHFQIDRDPGDNIRAVR